MAGRPLKYRTLHELQEAIDAYFARCDAEERPYTVTGLALALGMDRKGLLEYQGRRQFTHAIEYAKRRIECSYEERLISNKGSAHGLMFVMKNNYGYQERIEQEITNNINSITDKPMELDDWLSVHGQGDGKVENLEDRDKEKLH